jgi:hypothetical protein
VTGAASRDSRWIVVGWDDHDRHRWLARTAGVGVVLAMSMALFGLPPVDLHGPLHYLGIMGPLCGMTRATRHFARFEVTAALEYNPAVLVLAFGGVLALGRSVYGWRTGRWLSIQIERRRTVIVVAVVLLVALSVRQQANVELLR